MKKKINYTHLWKAIRCDGVATFHCEIVLQSGKSVWSNKNTFSLSSFILFFFFYLPSKWTNRMGNTTADIEWMRTTKNSVYHQTWLNNAPLWLQWNKKWRWWDRVRERERAIERKRKSEGEWDSERERKKERETHQSYVERRFVITRCILMIILLLLFCCWCSTLYICVAFVFFGFVIVNHFKLWMNGFRYLHES